MVAHHAARNALWAKFSAAAPQQQAIQLLRTVDA